jgi:hypothetical protein
MTRYSFGLLSNSNAIDKLERETYRYPSSGSTSMRSGCSEQTSSQHPTLRIAFAEIILGGA